jgi:hypothetical protein
VGDELQVVTVESVALLFVLKFGLRRANLGELDPATAEALHTIRSASSGEGFKALGLRVLGADCRCHGELRYRKRNLQYLSKTFFDE